MKHSNVPILFTSSLLLLTPCREETNSNNDESIKNSVKESNQRSNEKDANIDALLGR